MNWQENDNYFDKREVVKDKPQTFFVYSFSNVKKKINADFLCFHKLLFSRIFEMAVVLKSLSHNLKIIIMVNLLIVLAVKYQKILKKTKAHYLFPELKVTS